MQVAELKGNGPETVPGRYEGLAGPLAAAPRFPMGLPRRQGLLSSELLAMLPRVFSVMGNTAQIRVRVPEYPF
jgi:hypothetical protein